MTAVSTFTLQWGILYRSSDPILPFVKNGLDLHGAGSKLHSAMQPEENLPPAPESVKPSTEDLSEEALDAISGGKTDRLDGGENRIGQGPQFGPNDGTNWHGKTDKIL